MECFILQIYANLTKNLNHSPTNAHTGNHTVSNKSKNHVSTCILSYLMFIFSNLLEFQLWDMNSTIDTNTCLGFWKSATLHSEIKGQQKITVNKDMQHLNSKTTSQYKGVPWTSHAQGWTLKENILHLTTKKYLLLTHITHVIYRSSFKILQICKIITKAFSFPISVSDLDRTHSLWTCEWECKTISVIRECKTISVICINKK